MEWKPRIIPMPWRVEPGMPEPGIETRADQYGPVLFWPDLLAIRVWRFAKVRLRKKRSESRTASRN
jgi:hypothetical protein